MYQILQPKCLYRFQDPQHCAISLGLLGKDAGFRSATGETDDVEGLQSFSLDNRIFKWRITKPFLLGFIIWQEVFYFVLSHVSFMVIDT